MSNSKVRNNSPYIARNGSPYVQRNSSPHTNNRILNKSTDVQSRIVELEASLSTAIKDLEILSFKAKKAIELEQKVEIILRHNASLLGENDQISKNLQQKKQEIESLKTKYDVQANTLQGIKHTQKLDIRALKDEISTLKDLINQIDVDRAKELEETLSKCEIDSKQRLNQLKLSHYNDIQIHQEQLKKIRDILEQRELEIQILQIKNQEQKKEQNLDYLKVLGDREKLRVQLSQIDIENQKNLEIIKSSIEKQNTQTQANQKQHYMQETQILQGEINNLKSLLDLKGQEISSLMSQIQEFHQNQEQYNKIAREEIQNLKDIIQQNNEQKEVELMSLQDRLNEHHTNDLQGLQYHNDNQQEALRNEINSLQFLLNDKSQEIQKQLMEKQKIKEIYQGETDRLSQELEVWQYQAHLTERQHNKDIKALRDQSDNTVKFESDYKKQFEEHIKELEKELRNLQLLLEDKNRDLEETICNHKKIRNYLENDIKTLQSDYIQLEHQKQEAENIQQIHIKDLEMRLKIHENEFNKKYLNLEHTIKCQDKEIESLQNIIQAKYSECTNLAEHTKQKVLESKALQDQIGVLQEQMNDTEVSRNNEKQTLKDRLEVQHSMVLDNVMMSHCNQVDILNGIISDHQAYQHHKYSEFNQQIDKFEQVEKFLNEIMNKPDDIKDKAQIATIQNLYNAAKKTRSPGKK